MRINPQIPINQRTKNKHARHTKYTHVTLWQTWPRGTFQGHLLPPMAVREGHGCIFVMPLFDNVFLTTFSGVAYGTDWWAEMSAASLVSQTFIRFVCLIHVLCQFPPFPYFQKKSTADQSLRVGGLRLLVLSGTVLSGEIHFAQLNSSLLPIPSLTDQIPPTRIVSNCRL